VRRHGQLSVCPTVLRWVLYSALEGAGKRTPKGPNPHVLEYFAPHYRKSVMLFSRWISASGLGRVPMFPVPIPVFPGPAAPVPVCPLGPVPEICASTRGAASQESSYAGGGNCYATCSVGVLCSSVGAASGVAVRLMRRLLRRCYLLSFISPIICALSHFCCVFYILSHSERILLWPLRLIS